MNFLTLDWLRWIGYALFILSLIPLALAFQQLLKSRRAKYYVARQSAIKQLRRWALLVLVLITLAAVSLLTFVKLPTLVPAPTSAPTLTITLSPTHLPSPEPSRTPTATATPTRRSTATAPFTPTPTPAPTLTSSAQLPEAALSPLPSAVPASEDASISLIRLDIEEGEPVGSANKFPTGQYPIHLVFEYEGMEDGVRTTFAWYRGGVFIERCSDTWLWGLVEGRAWGESGQISYYCNPATGWEPGSYRINVFIEDRLQGVAEFEVEATGG